MRLLFIHQNFPGQFRYLAPHLARDGSNQVVAILDAGNDIPNRDKRGIRLVTYASPPAPSKDVHPYLAGFETAVRRGQQVARTCLGLRKEGFAPDVIVAHPGWGEALYVKDIYPGSRLLNYCEYFCHSKGTHVNFDPEYPQSLHAELMARTDNAVTLLSLDSCDWGICPTQWQWGLHPAEYRPKISVVFDGIETDYVKPNAKTVVSLGDGRPNLTSADEVITFVSRGLEPSRGFHSLMRALPAIQERHPNAYILIVGGDEPAYGPALPGQTYREKHLAEMDGKIDLQRIVFLGKIGFAQYLAVLQVSTVHIYLTYPFVLSWSMIEAMSAGCLVVGSRTAPVQEIIEDNCNGLLVDFFSPAEIAAAVHRVLAHPDRMAEIRQRARQTVLEKFDLDRICLPRQLGLIEELAAGRLPRLAADASVHPS